jgi:hypothetical protein
VRYLSAKANIAVGESGLLQRSIIVCPETLGEIRTWHSILQMARINTCFKVTIEV